MKLNLMSFHKSFVEKEENGKDKNGCLMINFDRTKRTCTSFPTDIPENWVTSISWKTIHMKK